VKSNLARATPRWFGRGGAILKIHLHKKKENEDKATSFRK
jgi:hypothetical protein